MNNLGTGCANGSASASVQSQLTQGVQDAAVVVATLSSYVTF